MLKQDVERCQVGDLVFGNRFLSDDGLREFIITNCNPIDSDCSTCVDLDNGFVRLINNSRQLVKTQNGKLRLWKE